MRRATPADLDAVYAIAGDPAACAHNPADLVRNRDEAAALLDRWLDHWSRFGFGYWAVRRHEEPEVLGFCGLKFLPLRDRMTLNLFYRFTPEAWGTGFGTEAATAAVNWARANRPTFPVVARVRPDNIDSQRVAIKAGLTRTSALDEQGQDGLDWIYELADTPTRVL